MRVFPPSPSGDTFLFKVSAQGARGPRPGRGAAFAGSAPLTAITNRFHRRRRHEKARSLEPTTRHAMGRAALIQPFVCNVPLAMKQFMASVLKDTRSGRFVGYCSAYPFV